MPRPLATAFAVVRLSPVSMMTLMPSAARAFRASGVEGLTRSATARMPASLPSTAILITVAPSLRSRSASASSEAVSMACDRKNVALPSWTVLPSPLPVTPLPAGASSSSTEASVRFRSFAARTIASASGCSLDRSTLATRRRISLSSNPEAGRIDTTLGLPSVSVPVLSTTRVSIFSIRSSASAFWMRAPAGAPRPTPTMIDIGVASPSAHGQAMIRTLTAATSPNAKRGSGPNMAHAAKARSATTSTAGTNQPATRSAMRWIGARDRCASATICTICDNTVSRPTLSAPLTNPRRTFHQRLDGPRGGFAGTQLKYLTEQAQDRDPRGGLEVDRHSPAVAPERFRKAAGCQRCNQAVDIGDAGAHRDQGEHVEIARHQRLPSASEERPAGPQNHRRREHKLDPVRQRGVNPAVTAGQVSAHLQNDRRQRQREADPEAAGSFAVMLCR